MQRQKYRKLRQLRLKKLRLRKLRLPIPGTTAQRKRQTVLSPGSLRFRTEQKTLNGWYVNPEPMIIFPVIFIRQPLILTDSATQQELRSQVTTTRIYQDSIMTGH